MYFEWKEKNYILVIFQINPKYTIGFKFMSNNGYYNKITLLNQTVKSSC